MTTIYLINNGLTMNNLNFDNNETLESKREKRILSIEGEEESRKLINTEYLQYINKIYTSNYVMAIGTAKYLANFLDLQINIKKELGERVIGTLGDKKIRFVNESQENDFDYKLNGGESLNDVKKRMLKFINNILINEENRTIALFTHNVAITSLLTEYCEKGFNLDNRLILNYNEDSIIDGAWDGIRIIELTFDKKRLINIKRKK